MILYYQTFSNLHSQVLQTTLLRHLLGAIPLPSPNALYGVTLSDFDLYVTADEIASAAHLKIEDVETAIRDFPLTVKEEDGVFKYRLEGLFSHIPPLLSFFYKL